MQLENVRALVTGASGGIGESLVYQLAASGARVMLAGRDHSALIEHSHLLGDACLETCSGDLTAPAARNTLAEAASRHNINVLINLMGINELRLVSQQSEEHIETLLNTNLTVQVLVTKQLLPVLLDNAPAQIVNIGSAFGSIGYPGYAVYCAAKFGLRGFSEALRRELADCEVDVLYIAPRATKTDMNCDKAMALNTALGNAEDSPEWVAKQIVKAIKRGRERTYLGWPEKVFVRLNGLFPRLVDKVLGKQLATIKKHTQGTT